MADIHALRRNTVLAANEAKSAEMLMQEQFERMTDGTVSLADVFLTTRLMDSAGGPRYYDGERDRNAITDFRRYHIAGRLEDAVAAQLKSQFFRSGLEDVKDLALDIKRLVTALGDKL